MIQHHPSQNMLIGFVNADLSNGTSLAVSAHLEFCSECQKQVEQIEARMAEQFISADDTSADLSFCEAKEDMLKAILASAKDETHGADVARSRKTDELLRNSEIIVNGQRFELPRPLQYTVKQTGSWQQVIGEIWRAPVNVDGVERTNYIMMEKGGRIAEHTHTGTEITLVLAGSFSDEQGDYVPGDFIVTDGTVKHQPYSKDQCLCFTVLDKPLHFTSGMARLLNPFSHLFF